MAALKARAQAICAAISATNSCRGARAGPREEAATETIGATRTLTGDSPQIDSILPCLPPPQRSSALSERQARLRSAAFGS